MRLLGTILMVIAGIGLIVFPAAYHVTSDGLWRHSRVGRSLMAFQGALALVMVLAIWAVFFGPLPQVVRVIVWGVIGAVAWRQVYLLFSVKARAARRRAVRR